MWTKLKSFLSSRVEEPEQKQILSSDFDNHVRKTINLIENTEELGEDTEVIEYLVRNGIEEAEARKILLFLPVAFTRQLLPMVKWPESYLRFSNGKKRIRKKYHDTEAFQIIWYVTTQYFENNPIRHTILKIAGRSSEFKVVNQLLLDSPNTKFEEIQLLESIITG